MDFRFLPSISMESIRIDKWLWAARFFKTRSLAQDEVECGRVLVGGARAKPSREIRVGDQLEIRRGDETFTVSVEAISAQRRSAAEAQCLYRETEESRITREQRKELLRLASEPSNAIQHGRPTKRDGRLLRRFKDGF